MTVSLLNGEWPVTSSYSMAPSEYVLGAGVSSRLTPAACSGATYIGVPIIEPARV